MKIFNRNDDNFSDEELEKAEILEAYTLKLKGKRLSQLQNRLLKSKRYEEELTPLKGLINKAHSQAEDEYTTEIISPRPGAARRVKTKISELISNSPKKSALDKFLSMDNITPAPAYDIDSKGSDSELEVTVYGEPIISNKFVIKFKIIEGEQEGKEYSVVLPKVTQDDKEEKSIKIGRGNSVEIRLKDLSRKISRVHAQLEVQNGSVYIKDLDSTNGTYVNGIRVTDKIQLSPDSIVKLGGVIIQILSIKKVS